MTVEKALRSVERAVREPVEIGPIESHERYIHQLHPHLILVDGQVRAVEELQVAMAMDPEFEYMRPRETEQAAREFAYDAQHDRSASHSAAFVERHAREPLELSCSFPVEGLTVHTELDLFGARFAPKNTLAVPEHFAAGLENIGAIVSATCFGTSGQAMMLRARERAEYALLLLRNGLCNHRGIHQQQLRFRLGDVYWFSDDVGGGWGPRPDAIFDASLTDELVELAT
jgi:hypothetical protein